MTPAELRKARAKMGVTQARMAELLNTPRRTYERWELDGSTIPGAVDIALDHVMNCKPNHR